MVVPVDRLASPRLRERVEVEPSRAEEPQEAQVLVPAGLVDAEEHQVIPQPLLGERGADDLPAAREQLDGILRVVVVPGDAVVVEEDKYLVPVFEKPLLIFLRHFRYILLFR